MDISNPNSKLNEALTELAACDFTEAELRAECETAIDNVMDDLAIKDASDAVQAALDYVEGRPG